MKQIETLVPDIEKLFLEPHKFDEKNVKEFGQLLATIIASRVNPPERGKPSLRMSNIGTQCDRKLWMSVNKSDSGEGLPFEARMKFLFGDILEALLLFFAVEAGHSVTGAQDELEVEGVIGHRDAVIDGVTVDCKSASTYSFKKFANHLQSDDDSFGYLHQLNSYLQAGLNDPFVLDKERAAFLVVDKTLGHVCLDVHKKTKLDMVGFINRKKKVVSQDVMPHRGYADEPEGKSGNRKLGMECSYCPFKQSCWPDLRTFYYARGPVHLTKVVREPKVEQSED
jgi:hypothetical protein